jgi:hypothetical protein
MEEWIEHEMLLYRQCGEGIEVAGKLLQQGRQDEERAREILERLLWA